MIDGSFEEVISFENLYMAYKTAKSNSNHSNQVLRFEMAALSGISMIRNLLISKKYCIDPYNEFTIYEPKERLIKAGSFKDKIVQHSLCDNVLLPGLKDEFILTNYAGQLEKGTDFALKCLKAHMQLAYIKYGCDCWIVKGDIRKFFYSIDHNILKDIVSYFVTDSDIYWLCEKFIDSTGENIGLALGNQIDQVFALMMLSGFDHFITGELGFTYYGRYADDFYIIVRTKDMARETLEAVKLFMNTLRLELNGKTQIIPFKNGIRFCGFHTYVTKEGKVIQKLINEKKRKNKKKYRKMAKLVKEGKLHKDKFDESYLAFKNHIAKGNCIKFGYEMDQIIDEILNKENAVS